MFNFTSLLGAQSSSPASQSILELEGGIKVLIDVGWDETFDVRLLEELEKYVLSHETKSTHLVDKPRGPLLKYTVGKPQLCPLSFSRMQQLPTLGPLHIAANTYPHSRAYPSTPPHPSFLWADPSSKISISRPPWPHL